MRDALERAGFYAYGTIDAENQWVVSADDEAGHVDVRVGADGYQLDLWATIPGSLLRGGERVSPPRHGAPGAHDHPRRAARLSGPNQAAWWDETEGGPAARIRYELPFTAAAQTGAFAREHLPELEQLLDFIATQVST